MARWLLAGGRGRGDGDGATRRPYTGHPRTKLQLLTDKNCEQVHSFWLPTHLKEEPPAFAAPRTVLTPAACCGDILNSHLSVRLEIGVFSSLLLPVSGVRCCERLSVHSCSCHQSLHSAHCRASILTLPLLFFHFVLFLSGLEHLLTEIGVLFYVILSFPFLSFSIF